MSDGDATTTASGPEIQDPEAVLMAVGALEEGDDGDLVLTEAFRAAWREEIADTRESDARREEIAEVLGLEGDVSFEVFQEAFRIRVDGALVGMLESEGAFYADLAAARLLADRLDRCRTWTPPAGAAC